MTTRDDNLRAPNVEARKAAILADLVRAQRGRVAARAARRSRAALLVFAMAMVLVLVMRPTVPGRAPVAAAPATLNFEIVRTPTREVRIERIDDDELITELRAAGIEAGMVTTDNRVFFVGR
ncbi:MAG: hypothetical protein JNM94_17780 [Phycisphaerae bacterium]|nr:hypothetical protein [Phycisphaerae bacterium]